MYENRSRASSEVKQREKWRGHPLFSIKWAILTFPILISNSIGTAVAPHNKISNNFPWQKSAFFKPEKNLNWDTIFCTFFACFMGRNDWARIFFPKREFFFKTDLTFSPASGRTDMFETWGDKKTQQHPIVKTFEIEESFLVTLSEIVRKNHSRPSRFLLRPNI